MKKIVFLTGTRADFGKMRLVILTLMRNKKFKVDVFVTGMHLMKKYGYTVEEIKKVGIKRLFKLVTLGITLFILYCAYLLFTDQPLPDLDNIKTQSQEIEKSVNTMIQDSVLEPLKEKTD